jgi:enoyl-CoA hydratase/carnithine racemase
LDSPPKWCLTIFFKNARWRWRANWPQGPPLALRAVKLMMRRAMESTLDSSLGDAQQAVLWVGPSADAKEGKAAFLAKRPPRFTGL